MAHARRQIRDEVVARVTGLTTTGARVYRSRSRSLSGAKLPAIKVWTRDEEIEEASGYDYQRRKLRLEVVALSKLADPDDELDQVCVEVEEALAADPTFGGLVTAAYLVSTEFEFDHELEKPVGMATMVWEIVYSVDSDTPETIV